MFVFAFFCRVMANKAHIKQGIVVFSFDCKVTTLIRTCVWSRTVCIRSWSGRRAGRSCTRGRRPSRPSSHASSAPGAERLRRRPPTIAAPASAAVLPASLRPRNPLRRMDREASGGPARQCSYDMTWRYSEAALDKRVNNSSRRTRCRSSPHSLAA